MLNTEIIQKAEETYLSDSVKEGNFENVHIALKNYQIDSVELKSDLLLVAMEAEQFAMAELLLQYGALPNAENELGQTPLHIFMSKPRKGCATLAEKLINSDNLNKQDDFGKTPLHYTCIDNKEEIVKLMDRGASAKIQAKNGKSALHYAVVHADIESIGAMLRKEGGGLMKIRDNQNHTAANYAKLANRKRVFKLLTNSFRTSKML